MDYSVSPYAYCGDNPINRIDPDGRSECKPEYKEPLIDLHTGEITNVLPDWYNQKVDRVEQPKYITADANKSDKTTKNNNDNSKSLGAALVVAVDAVGLAITASEVFVAGVMAAVVICPGDTPLDHKKEYKPVPADLPGFPGAKRTKPKAGRARWKLPNGDIGEWDSQHGEVEVYDKTGKNHKGAYDPKSGEKKKTEIQKEKLNLNKKNMSDYKRLICYFDKKTELLVNKFSFEVDTNLLHKIFIQYQDDEKFYMSYEIGFKESQEINKIIDINFDFEKYDYFMEVWSFE